MSSSSTHALLSVMQNNKPFSIRLSHNQQNGKFFVDFWNVDEDGDETEYVMSLCISEIEAMALSREIGVKILQ